MPVLTTACPRNCYSTCSLRVKVENGRLASVEPHPGNRATGLGVCLKGLSYVERNASPHRLLRPLARKDGGFVPESWDEALDRMAAAFARIRDAHGAQAVLYYAASGSKGLLNGVAFLVPEASASNPVLLRICLAPFDGTNEIHHLEPTRYTPTSGPFPRAVSRS